jgi:hypothetical protein
MTQSCSFALTPLHRGIGDAAQTPGIVPDLRAFRNPSPLCAVPTSVLNMQTVETGKSSPFPTHTVH